MVCHVLYGNTLIMGKNSDKTSPRYRRVCQDGNVSYARHAEMHALDQIPHDFNPRRIKVYVMRYSKSGQLCMAKPCKDCQYRLYSMGIRPRNIWFTNALGRWEQMTGESL